jgi:hypothetical protein
MFSTSLEFRTTDKVLNSSDSECQTEFPGRLSFPTRMWPSTSLHGSTVVITLMVYIVADNFEFMEFCCHHIYEEVIVNMKINL